jgi:hypothetical protein
MVSPHWIGCAAEIRRGVNRAAQRGFFIVVHCTA